MKHQLIVSVIATIALAATQASQAAHLDNLNLLTDAGFEDPGSITDGPAPFTGRWQSFSLDGDHVTGEDTAQYSTTMPRTDAGSAELFIGNAPNSFAGLFQDVYFGTGQAGQDWWYSGWHKLQGNSGGSEIRVEWRDSVTDTEVSRTPNSVPIVGTTYEEYILTDTVPAGADTARVVYAIQSFGGVVDQTIYLDDLNFNIAGFVPEPTTGLLALIGLAPLARRRR